jgi:hypothetical protein
LPATTTGPAAEITIGALPAFGRASFVNHQGTAHKLPPIANLHRLRGSILVVNLHESEAPRFPAESIAHNVHAIDLNSRFGKERLKVGFSRFIRQVPYKQSGHFTLLDGCEETGWPPQSRIRYCFSPAEFLHGDVSGMLAFCGRIGTEEPYEPKTDNSK